MLLGRATSIAAWTAGSAGIPMYPSRSSWWSPREKLENSNAIQQTWPLWVRPTPMSCRARHPELSPDCGLSRLLGASGSTLDCNRTLLIVNRQHFCERGRL